MKKLLLVAALLVAGVTAMAQGTVNFNNRVTASGIDAKILNDKGVAIDGAAGWAQLYAGTSATSLSAVGSPINFRTGAAAGYFNGGEVLIPASVLPTAGGAAFVQVRAWLAASGNSYEAALANPAGVLGKSAVINLAATGNPNSLPPGTPVDMVGLTAFNLALVPEPSTIALGLLGAAALLAFRRK